PRPAKRVPAVRIAGRGETQPVVHHRAGERSLGVGRRECVEIAEDEGYLRSVSGTESVEIALLDDVRVDVAEHGLGLVLAGYAGGATGRAMHARVVENRDEGRFGIRIGCARVM